MFDSKNETQNLMFNKNVKQHWLKQNQPGQDISRNDYKKNF